LVCTAGQNNFGIDYAQIITKKICRAANSGSINSFVRKPTLSHGQLASALSLTKTILYRPLNQFFNLSFDMEASLALRLLVEHHAATQRFVLFQVDRNAIYL